MNIYKDVQCNIVMTVKTVTNKGKYNNLLYTCYYPQFKRNVPKVTWQ